MIIVGYKGYLSVKSITRQYPPSKGAQENDDGVVHFLQIIPSRAI